MNHVHDLTFQMKTAVAIDLNVLYTVETKSLYIYASHPLNEAIVMP